MMLANGRRGITVFATTLVVVVASTLAVAAPGDLDVTFDGDGIVTTDFGGTHDRAYGMAIQPNGKILAVGFARYSSGTRDFALARYNSDGSLDIAFDGDGKVTTDFDSGALFSDIAHAVAVQANGKIIAAGGSLGNFALARYNSDGSPDATFGGDGKITTDFGGPAHSVAIQGDGKIVAAGIAGTNFTGNFRDFALARYNSDGSLDDSFGGDGKVTTDFAGSHDSVTALAIQSDGRTVAAGYAVLSDTYQFALARYNPDGSLDTTFDGDGKATNDFGSPQSEGHAVTIQADGRIVVAGRTLQSGQLDFGVARYNNDGSLDVTFGGDGEVTTDFGVGNDNAHGVAIQQDGRIVAAGCAGHMCEDSSDDLGLARYNTDGSLDITFGGDGKVITDFSGDTDWAQAVAIQSNGKIVTVGFSAWNPSDFAVARYKGCRLTSRRTSIPC